MQGTERQARTTEVGNDAVGSTKIVKKGFITTRCNDTYMNTLVYQHVSIFVQ
jgi:hypothetical protein